MPEYMRNKISKKFINLIEQNKDNTYISKIRTNVPIREQELSETTEAMLALIYRDYLCSEDERKKLLISEYEEIQKLKKGL